MKYTFTLTFLNFIPQTVCYKDFFILAYETNIPLIMQSGEA
jgi:hypothetical protein